MSGAIKLYELSAARDILDTWLAESDGEVTPELDALLDELDGQTDEKIERVALYVRERLATAAAVKEERNRLDAIVKREEKAAESLKGYLKTRMERLGKTKVNGLLCTVAIQNNSVASVTTALESDDLRDHYNSAGDPLLPYILRTVTYSINRESVLAATKTGGTVVPPEIIVERGTHLRIR